MPLIRAHDGIGRIAPHMLGGASATRPAPRILLNSNECALGPSPRAVTAAQEAAGRMERYVENVDSVLVPAIARRYGLPAERITCGQGSDDLLARLVRGYLPPGKALMRSANGYLKVPNYAHANNGVVINVADDGFRPSVDRMIAALTDETRIVYLANPENPAGTYLSGAEVRRLHAALPDHVLLVLDCAYEEYVDAEDYEPGHLLAGAAENVVMCRTFSKVHGLAGARVGWLYGSAEVVDTVKRLALTFPIATPSLAAALAALEDREHAGRVAAENARLRQMATARLNALGLHAVPSQTNFLLIHLPDPDRSAEALDAALLKEGIALRRMAAPAYKDHIRMTLGHAAEIEEALEAIARFMAGAGS